MTKDASLSGDRAKSEITLLWGDHKRKIWHREMHGPIKVSVLCPTCEIHYT